MVWYTFSESLPNKNSLFWVTNNEKILLCKCLISYSTGCFYETIEGELNFYDEKSFPKWQNLDRPII